MAEIVQTRAWEIATMLTDIANILQDFDAKFKKNSIMLQEIINQIKELNAKFSTTATSDEHTPNIWKRYRHHWGLWWQHYELYWKEQTWHKTCKNRVPKFYGDDFPSWFTLMKKRKFAWITLMKQRRFAWWWCTYLEKFYTGIYVLWNQKVIFQILHGKIMPMLWNQILWDWICKSYVWDF